MAAQAAFHSAADGVKVAKQNVEETAILYRQGLATALELVDANDSRFTADVNLRAPSSRWRRPISTCVRRSASTRLERSSDETRPVRVPLVVLAVSAARGLQGSETDSNLKKGKGVTKMAYPVTVAPLAMRQVKYNVTAPGSLDAFQQVQVTARVGGAVDKVSFVEGQNVKQGDLLVTIEVDRYQVAVEQAKTAVDKAGASQKAAEAELARRQQAVADHPGLVAGEEVETYATNVATTKADVAAAQENVRVAQLNLRDAYVRAPFSGVIQSRPCRSGSICPPGRSSATLLQRDPLLLRFGVAESDAPRLSAGMIANIKMRESTNTYTGEAHPRRRGCRPHDATGPRHR